MKSINDINIAVVMLSLNVFPYVSLVLAHVVAVRTLEPRLLAALVAKMSVKVPFPREDARAIRIRT